jgi:Tol biopolymer transport system component
MSWTQGQVLGSYRLVEAIGQGGMGVVWKAHDTTLGRDVALKVLPEVFGADPERIARLEREARLLAALNHPNIASIYGFHTVEGVSFLAMELAEGEDLAARLARGPVPLEEALPIARQIAEALEAAHEKGIVHRDLKPANVKVAPGGQVKVLDFGLARAFEGDPTGSSASLLTQSPTITGRMTGANVILGTAAYMSPEQARGQVADRRADIWAFGVVLYEMVSGRQLFAGETVSDTLAGVLKTDPDWSALPGAAPARLRTLLRRCLERNPRLRLRDIGEARIVLDEVMRGGAEETAGMVPAGSPALSGTRAWAVAALAAALGAAVAVMVVGSLRPKDPPIPLRRYQLPVAGVTNGVPAWSRISPDGRTVAYFVGDTLWAQPLDALEPVRIAASDAIPRNLFWSPDSKQIGYLSGSRVWKVPLAGGTPQVVCETREAFTGGSGASWRPDDVILFSAGDSLGILQVPASGGDAQPFIRPDLAVESDLHEPFALPGGRGVLFCPHRVKEGFDNITLWHDGQRKVLLELPGQQIWRPIYISSGHILFRRAGNNPGIWALPFSLARRAATGPAFIVEPDATDPSVSQDGTLAFLGGGGGGLAQFQFFTRDGRATPLEGAPLQMDRRPALSPDGRRIAYSQTTGEHSDLWVLDVDRGTRTRLSFEPGDEWFASWSPDGQQVVYQAMPPAATSPDQMRVLMRRVDGAGAVDTLGAGVGGNFTPDGRSVTFSQIHPGHWDIQVVAIDGDRKPTLFLASGAWLFDARVSPDGRLISYMSNESGDFQVYLKRFPSGEGKWQVSTAGGEWARWNGRGDRLDYVQGTDVMEVTVGGTDSPILGTPQRLFSTGALGSPNSRWLPAVDVTSDGQRFLATLQATTTTHARGVTVVQNWFSAFAGKR